MGRKEVFVIFLGVLIIGLGAGPAWAEIYKYQDSDGNWHFTDAAPEGEAQQMDSAGRSGGSTPASGKDLKADLRNRYKPSSPVEAAALAAVTIKTSIGTGSGFFVTENGHILTNRHVIQTSPDTLERSDAAMAEMERRFDRADRQIRAEQQRLRKFSQHLNQYKVSIDRMPRGAERQREKQRYALEKERYEDYKKRFEQQKAEYEDKKTEYESQIRSYRYKNATSGLSRHFKVICKDGREIPSYLVAKSRSHDLALLKIDGYKTPFIAPASPGPLSQGDQVYAIGSPMGLRDSMSRGIIAGFKSSFIQTDAKIYPGN
ncbi:MAG: trypsin-like peptidase domain-containing protein, partial [Desulfosalsimonas sp.]